jgi:hypothetical protein
MHGLFVGERGSSVLVDVVHVISYSTSWENSSLSLKNATGMCHCPTELQGWQSGSQASKNNHYILDLHMNTVL